MDAADLVAVALLAEPVRQRLYSYLRERHEPVGREDAARNAGIAVKLAAFHLDRMADAGLLEVEYRRLSGRVGPGAGRPAKLYSVSPRAISIVIPQTRYALAASMMATALSGGFSGSDGAGYKRSQQQRAKALVPTFAGGRIAHGAKPSTASSSSSGTTRSGRDPGSWTSATASSPNCPSHIANSCVA